jgi:hypothetical protein
MPVKRDGCKQAADALITYGALLLHDSRVSEEDNDVFLDLIEDYFEQPESELKKDERPELGYQVCFELFLRLSRHSPLLRSV